MGFVLIWFKKVKNVFLVDVESLFKNGLEVLEVGLVLEIDFVGVFKLLDEVKLGDCRSFIFGFNNV